MQEVVSSPEFHRPLGKWQCEANCAPFSQFRLYPDTSTMDLDNPLDNGKTCSRSFAFLIHFIEKLEDFVVLAGVYANSIIPDKKGSILSIDPLPDLYFWIRLKPHVLYAVFY